jgi:uroporphyrinogen-III decarboxylase
MTVDAPEALKELFEVMTRRQIESHSLAASLAECDAVVGVDDTSTTTQSPAMFEEYCVEYTNHVADAIHAKGKLYFHHSCGLIKDLLHLYRQTRMDAVHALQVPPLGNIMVREAKQALGDRIVIFASLNQLWDPLDDWAAVCRSVREMFEGAALGDNFLLGLAPDPNVNMADTIRFRAEVMKYQRMYGSGS